MGTYQAQINSIEKYGMVGTLDIEVPLWVNTGFNANADLSPYLPQLKAQAAAGWSYFAAEGIGRAGVATIGSVRPYINYGDENGANMYAGQYNHAPNAHFANLLETYHKYAIDAYKASTVAAKANCPRYGLTLMMYNPSDLEQDTTALINYINQVGGVQDILMWTGVVSDVLSVFSSPWIDIVNVLNANFGFRTDAPWSTITPTPPSTAIAFKAATGVQGGVDELALGSDTAVWNKSVDGKWYSLGGSVTSAPVGVYRNGLLDVFVRGMNGRCWHIPQRSGTIWGAWEDIGGDILAGTQPTATVDANGIKVLVIGVYNGKPNGTWKKTYSPVMGWSGWTQEDNVIRA
jgi:hypothetical protein